MAEGTRLLSEYGVHAPSRVRIPPSPLKQASISAETYLATRAASARAGVTQRQAVTRPRTVVVADLSPRSRTLARTATVLVAPGFADAGMRSVARKGAARSSVGRAAPSEKSALISFTNRAWMRLALSAATKTWPGRTQLRGRPNVNVAPSPFVVSLRIGPA